MCCAVLRRRLYDGSKAMVYIGYSVLSGVSFTGVQSFSLVWLTVGEGPPSAVAPKSLFVGHTARRVRLGDSGHGNLTATPKLGKKT